MATLDIRDEQEKISRIEFDGSDGGLMSWDGELYIKYTSDSYILCSMCDIDDFIRAAQKAKELWAK